MQPIVIRSEEEAWAVLEKALEGRLEAEFSSIEFQGWPTLTVHLEGPKFHGSITTSVMESLIEVQKNLNRSYALLTHDKSDRRHITDEEKDEIEIIFKVKDGSTELEAALANALEKLAITVGDKMEPVHVVVTVLGLATLYFAHSAFRHWTQQKIEEKKINIDAISKQEDTKRFEMLAKAKGVRSELSLVADDAEDAHSALIRAASLADKASVMGVELEKDAFVSLTKVSRERSKDLRIDGEYRVVMADNTDPSDKRCRLIGNDGQEFIALIDDERWPQHESNHFQAAFWNATTVRLKVNARMLRGQVTAATVVGVDVQNGPG